MDIDHIFIFSGDKGKIAEKLVSSGLTEGESRVHRGQGTSNRTFVFENFYLEILWVHNEQEIESELTRPTGLWTRAIFKENNCSPFGLCIANTDETEQLFKNALKYQPDYFPAGMTMNILNNDNNLDLPLTFRLPFKRKRKKETKLPNHENRITALTNANFQHMGKNSKNFLKHFKNEETIKFSQTDMIWLTLTFDEGIQGLTKEFEELKLTINY